MLRAELLELEPSHEVGKLSSSELERLAHQRSSFQSELLNFHLIVEEPGLAHVEQGYWEDQEEVFSVDCEVERQELEILV